MEGGRICLPTFEPASASLPISSFSMCLSSRIAQRHLPHPERQGGELTCISPTLYRPLVGVQSSLTHQPVLGKSFPTNHNTGEISSLYHILRWVSEDDKELPTDTPRRINLITDREYCVRLFGNNSYRQDTTNRLFTA